MRVMSLNLRFDNPADGKYTWDKRFPAVRNIWQKTAADIIGTQEGLPHQVNSLKGVFADYRAVGSGRESDGSGEQTAVFYLQERFNCLDSGHFWLSDTPDIPGSRSFGNHVCRMASWLVLEDFLLDRKILFLNTHLDHESKPARLKGVCLINRFLARKTERGGIDGVIVTGDLNDTPDSRAVKVLQSGSALRDALAASGENCGTFHNYTGKGLLTIDYIFCSLTLQAVQGRVVTDIPAGIYPSDHFPIYADLEW